MINQTVRKIYHNKILIIKIKINKLKIKKYKNRLNNY